MEQANPGLSRRRVIIEAICVLYIYYVLATVFTILPPILFSAAGVRLDLRPGTAVSLLGVVIAEALALWMASAYFRRQQLSMRACGWLAPTSARIVFLAIIAAMAYSLYTAQIPEVRANLFELSPLKLWGLIAGVFGAFVEEVIFRGYLLARLQKAGMSNISQIVLSALTFGLLHLGFGWWGVLCTATLGLCLGALYVYGNRSLTGPLICHGLINAIIEPWLMLWLLKFYAERFGT